MVCSVFSRRCPLALCFLLALAAMLLLAAPDASAAKRILLVGDSWAQWPWDMGAFQSVLNGVYGTNTYEVEGTYTALGGTTADQWAHNVVPPEGTFPSPPGHTNMPMLDRISWCLNQYPTIDIIHLSISGNDMWSWRVGWTADQENALFDTIQQNVQTVVDWIHANHPRVKVLLVDYDFLNITENCTYGMAEYSNDAALFSAALGFTLGDVFQNKANTQVLNTFFTHFSPRKIAVAQSTPRTSYIQNWGIVQWSVGYTDSLGTFFAPQTVPFPGMAPSYLPLPGGDITYGTPPTYMNPISTSHPKQCDTIHLSPGGYKLLMDNCIMQYYNGWLTDTTAPLVQSITRAQPSPTTAAQAQFLVTFTQGVRGVGAADFALTGTAAAGASILSVTGAEDSATRTVTVDLSGAPDGLLGLNFVDDDTVFNANWNAVGGEGAGNGDYSAGEQYLVDRARPTGTIVINNNQSVTNNRNVTLSLTWSDGTGSGAIRMRFSDDGATWTAWEPLAATKAHTLPEGEGYKTVRVMYRDKVGNSSIAYSDYIRVDTIPPTGAIVINNGALSTKSPNVTLSLTWSDGPGSGVSRMRFSIDGAHWTAWEPTATTKAYTLPSAPGYYTVRVTYRDAGGNISPRCSNYIKLVP